MLASKTPAQAGPAPKRAARAGLAAQQPPLRWAQQMLWRSALPLQPRAAPDGKIVDITPQLNERGLSLPADLVDAGVIAAESDAQWYWAVVAHAEAHLQFSRQRLSTAGLSPITQVLVGVLEDARVELAAAQTYPGLGRLWRQCHRQAAASAETQADSLESLLRRLAHALADADWHDAHPWVVKGRALFAQYLAQEQSALQANTEAQILALRQIASALGHDLGQMRKALNPRSYRPEPHYRDDNQWLWYRPGADKATPPPPPQQPTAPAPERRPDQVLHYPEWDQRIRRLRRDWCAVHVYAPDAAEGDPPPAAVQSAPVQLVASQLQRWSSRRPRRSQQRSQDASDQLDWAAAVQWAIDQRSQHDSDARIYLRQGQQRKAAGLVLLDHSLSTHKSAQAAAQGEAASSVLALHQTMANGLLQAMAKAQWHSAAYGFCSDGRQRIHMATLKHFEEAHELAVQQQRIARLQSQYSTRLGAALRHAGALLCQRPESERLLLVLGDAGVHDIDSHDPQYLWSDAKQALSSLRRAGVVVVCLCASGDSSQALTALWGVGQWVRVSDAGQLAVALRRCL